MTKGERLDKYMQDLLWGVRLNWGEIDDIGMDMDKEGAIKILGQRKHTSRGSKLMNFD
jgi:hypothetical protein